MFLIKGYPNVKSYIDIIKNGLLNLNYGICSWSLGSDFVILKLGYGMSLFRTRVHIAI